MDEKKQTAENDTQSTENTEPRTWIMVKPKDTDQIFPFPLTPKQHDHYLKLLGKEPIGD